MNLRIAKFDHLHRCLEPLSVSDHQIAIDSILELSQNDEIVLQRLLLFFLQGFAKFLEERQVVVHTGEVSHAEEQALYELFTVAPSVAKISIFLPTDKSVMTFTKDELLIEDIFRYLFRIRAFFRKETLTEVEIELIVLCVVTDCSL